MRVRERELQLLKDIRARVKFGYGYEQWDLVDYDMELSKDIPLTAQKDEMKKLATIKGYNMKKLPPSTGLSSCICRKFEKEMCGFKLYYRNAMPIKHCKPIQELAMCKDFIQHKSDFHIRFTKNTVGFKIGKFNRIDFTGEVEWPIRHFK